jgi:phosphatidylglycerophosphatase A
MANNENATSHRRAPILYIAIATLMGTGYFPIAPATAASLLLCFVIWFVPRHPLILIPSVLVLLIIGIWTASRLEQFWGEDDRRIVIDEAVGIIITLFLIPQKILFFIVGFLLFRFFDILKPYPINISQHLPKGWGVMIDDIVAGIYSNILLWAFIILFHRIL